MVKNIVITGATGGLGSSLVDKLCQNPENRLFLISKSLEKMRKLTKMYSNPLHLYECDFSFSDFGWNLLNNLSVFFDNKIDAVINCVGTQEPIGKFVDSDWRLFTQNVEVNLLSPLLVIKTVLPVMIRQKYGKIINVSGGGSTTSRPDFMAYGISKTALVRFTETLAEEVRPYNIDVNIIAPGKMNTQMTDEIISHVVSEIELNNAKETHRQDAEETKKDALDLITSLLSPEYDGITGRFIAAAWDKWQDPIILKIANENYYKLRRITP